MQHADKFFLLLCTVKQKQSVISQLFKYIFLIILYYIIKLNCHCNMIVVEIQIVYLCRIPLAEIDGIHNVE